MDDDWLAYEYQSIKEHAATYPEANVRHWTHVPESMLIEAGYIHDANTWRLDRKRRFEADPTLNQVSDYGLDGLARIRPGEFHGLQAKRRKTGSFLRACDVGTYMSVIHRMRLKHPESRGFLYTDAKLTHELSDDMTLHPAFQVVRMPLEAPTKVVASAPPAMSAWPHQLEAIAALQASNEPRGALIMPPGSGKTFVMGAWGRDAARVVVCSPTRALAAQTLDAMSRLMPDHRLLLVDSDSAGTREASVVAAAWAADGPLLISTTYASMCDLGVGCITADAIVMVDEGHHLAGDARLCAATAELQCRVLIVTGTPPAALLDDDVDDETAPFPIVYQYPYDRAVRDERICDYRIYLPLIQDPVGDRDHDELVVALGADIVSRCHFLANGMLRAGATRCIVYAGTVEEAETYRVTLPRLAAQFHGICAWSGLITGETAVTRRDEQLAAFQARNPLFRWFFMCSVRVLDEGIDVPACDGVYISQSIGNQSRFVQRMCRANRLDYPGKVASVFVWSDEVDLDATLRATARVAGALSRTDQSMRVERVSTDYAGAIAASVDADFIDRVRVTCATASERWHFRMQQADAFMSAHHKRPSQKSRDPVEKRLGIWVNNQIARHAPDPATSQQIMKDPIIHLAWATLITRQAAMFESSEQAWRRSANETEAFMSARQKRPSQKSLDRKEKRLGMWVCVQIKNHAADPAKSKDIMKNPDVHSAWVALVVRHAALFESPDQAWRRSATETEAFMSARQKRPSCKSRDPVEKRLGNWVNKQVAAYAADPATSRNIMKNPDVHSAWAALVRGNAALFESPELAWRRSADEADAFMSARQKRPSQKSRGPEEKRLGCWVTNQIANHAADPETSQYIMKNPVIHSAWVALVQRNAVLFKH